MTEGRSEYVVTPKGCGCGKGGGAASDPLERAIGIALEAHAGQADDAG